MLKRKKEKKRVKLDWKDYVAITIAMLETVLLPFILYIIILFALAVIFGLL